MKALRASNVHEKRNNKAGKKLLKKRMKALGASTLHEKKNNKAVKKLLKKKESIALGAFTVKAPQNSLTYMRKLAIFM